MATDILSAFKRLAHVIYLLTVHMYTRNRLSMDVLSHSTGLNIVCMFYYTLRDRSPRVGTGLVIISM